MKIVCLIFFLFTVNSILSQSKINIEKERSLFKTNKVKLLTIDQGNGYKSVINYDYEGKPVTENGYYNNQEANITHYKYDSYGNLTEMTYLGYESGDYIVSIYEYDNAGNVVRTKEGSYESEPQANGDYTEYTYDGSGNILTKTNYWYENNILKSQQTVYNNIYENDNMTSSEEECSSGNSEAAFIVYTYDYDNRKKSETVYSKDCNTKKLTNTNEITHFDYCENGLINKTIFAGTYTEGMTTTLYKYEFYK